MFFDEKVNQGVSEKKIKTRDVSVLYHVYASKYTEEEYKRKQDL